MENIFAALLTSFQTPQFDIGFLFMSYFVKDIFLFALRIRVKTLL